MNKLTIDEIFNIFEEWDTILDSDEDFDDGLIISYECIIKPTFRIVYDPTVNRKLLEKKIPQIWKDLEKSKQIILDIHEYCEEENILK